VESRSGSQLGEAPFHLKGKTEQKACDTRWVGLITGS
jgi:hypothetical protein